MTKKLQFILFSLAVALLFTGCHRTEESQDDQSGTADTTKVIPADSAVEVYYQVPSPSELLDFLQAMGNKGVNIELSKPTLNENPFSDNKSKALNFGVYITDLLYCSNFGKGPEAVNYFITIKKLSDELGISSTISAKTKERIEKNFSNIDSLKNISNDLYYSFISKLEEGNQGKTIALIIIGGWVEGVYILDHFASKAGMGSSAMERLADQKYSLENLLGLSKQYSAEPGMKQIQTQLEDLKKIFDSINEKTVNVSADKPADEGAFLNMTQVQFNAIEAKINEIRKSIIELKS
jgi:hypothetical protein